MNNNFYNIFLKNSSSFSFSNKYPISKKYKISQFEKDLENKYKINNLKSIKNLKNLSISYLNKRPSNKNLNLNHSFNNSILIPKININQKVIKNTNNNSYDRNNFSKCFPEIKNFKEFDYTIEDIMTKKKE